MKIKNFALYTLDTFYSLQNEFKNDIDNNTLLIIFGQFCNKSIDELKEENGVNKIIIFHQDPYFQGYTFEKHYRKMLDDCDEIWDYDINNIEKMKYNKKAKLHIVKPFIKLNYIPIKNRKYDVLFYGIITERRKKILNTLLDKGLRVCILSDNNVKWGDELNEYIENSKCLLNIHAYNDNFQELARMCRWLNNGYIISEKSKNNYYKSQIHEYEYDELVDKVIEYISNLNSDNIVIPSDKTYILHVAESNDRYIKQKESHKLLNIENQISFWYTSKKPKLYNLLLSSLEKDEEPQFKYKCWDPNNCYYLSWKNNGSNVLYYIIDGSLQLYQMISVALAMNYEHIFIFENDWIFKNNKRLIKDSLDNMPYDYDIIRFYCSYSEEIYKKLEKSNEYYICYEDLGKEYSYMIYNGVLGLIALSRKGMETFIKFFEEKSFNALDLPLMCPDYFYKEHDCKCYVATKMIIENLELPSSIWS